MYVYGVVRAGARRRLPESGVGGCAVMCLAEGDLGALVSEGVEEPVRPSRRNVMAHSAVLQEVVAQGDVLPMRFGVVMPSASAVRDELLGAHAVALRAELEAHAGCVELDVTVTSHEDAQLRRALAADPALRAARGRLAAAGMQERISFGERVAQALEAERLGVVDAVVAALEPHVVGVVPDEPRHVDMLASLAFLVERRRVASFETTLEAVTADLGTERQVRCVGPVPPYHFVDLGLEEEATWA